MFCNKCGHPNREDSKYCTECGKKFSKKKNNPILYVFIVLSGVILLAYLAYNFFQKSSIISTETSSKSAVTITTKQISETSMTNQTTLATQTSSIPTSTTQTQVTRIQTITPEPWQETLDQEYDKWSKAMFPSIKVYKEDGRWYAYDSSENMKYAVVYDSPGLVRLVNARRNVHVNY